MTQEKSGSNQTQTKKGNGLLAKAAIVGVVAGLLGGGLSYAGLNQLNQDNNSTTPQATVATSGGKVTSTSANRGEMTGAFDQVKSAVVSVMNLQKEKSSSKDTNVLFGIFGDDSGSSKKSDKLKTYSEGSGVIYMK